MKECVLRMKAHGVCLLSCVSMWERHVTYGGMWWQLPNPLVVCEGMWMLIRSVHPIHLLVKTDLTYPNLKPLVGFRGWVIRLGWNFILSFWLS